VNRQQWIDFQQSDHYKKAKLTCFACHTAHGDGTEHGLKKTARDNSLCAQCHTSYSDVAALQAHTRHKTIDPAKGLGRCVDCHMPAAAMSAVPYESHSHTFKVLSPQVTLDKKMPNSCAVGCHRDGRFNAPTFGIVDASLARWDEASDAALATRLLQGYPTVTVLASDFNGDGKVDFDDFFLFAAAFGAKRSDAGFDPKYDLDKNGVVDFTDFFIFAADFGKTTKSSKATAARPGVNSHAGLSVRRAM
jgi:predicted CXXCH cytochrome family protein